jgi:hypothetical protein
MTKLAMGTGLSIEAPPFPLKDLDHLSYLHGLRLEVECDGLS